MRTIDYLNFVLDCIVGGVCLFRVCTGRGEGYDYIVLFFLAVILPYDISRIIKVIKGRKETATPGTGGDDLCGKN